MWTVHRSKSETNVAMVDVKKGDTIDFVSDYNSEISYDQHKWSITIETLDDQRTTWNSVKQFRGQENSEWVTFAHAILMTNEFLFID